MAGMTLPAIARRRLLPMPLLVLVGAALAPTAFAADATPGPSWGEHGMLLFGGTDGLHASHLPMYHRPHDVQAVLRLRAVDPRVEAALRRDLAAHPSLWTLVPEHFELDRLAPDAASPLASFKADIVRGHFERGGRTTRRAVAFAVERVEVWRRLDPAAPKPAMAVYRVVGEREKFAVAEIGPRPGVDHVVRLPANAPTRIELPAGPLGDASEQALAKATGGRVRTIYRETGDLAE